jgi:phospho-N-acetylmuramoyl-pentapeptide-transferase
MGGLAFLISILLLVILLLPFLKDSMPKEERYTLLIAVFFCIANGAIGIVDDVTKLRHHRNEGLTPWQKLVLQTTFAAAFLAILRLNGTLGERLQLSFLGTIPMGFATYFALMILLLGIVNCANLTDGIDGLAASVAAVIFAFYALLSARLDTAPTAVIASLLLGCALSFLFFNRHPAKIFMGDTGSLFLGAGAAALPLLLNAHLFALLCSIVYVLEGVSVILQVLFYKKTGKRLFLMAPIHHHLEKCGWSENKIVFAFALLTAVSCALCWFLPL